MFYPREMTEIELVVPAKDMLPVTTALSGQGIFHQTDSSYLSSASEADKENNWPAQAANFSAVERRLQSIINSLGIKEGSPPDDGHIGLAALEPIEQLVGKIEAEVRQNNDHLAAEYRKVEHLESLQEQLQPVVDFNLDLSQLHEARFLYSTLGIMPVENMERLQTSLSRVPNVFLPLHQANQTAVVWLAGPKSNADVLERAARSAYLNPLNLPVGYSGTPSEMIRSMREEVAAAQHRIAELKSEQTKLSDQYEKDVRSTLWDVRSSRMLLNAITRFGQLKYTYLIVGWTPSQKVEQLRAQIKRVSEGAVMEAFPAKREDPDNVPVDLDNPRALLPFQGLVTNYGRPKYNELDPTILLTITFPLLFGAMFGDVGQGFVLAALGWLLSSKKVKALRGMAGLGGVLTACGLSAAVFGVLYGSIFGLEHVIPALWLHPMEHIMDILIVAIVAGVLLLTLGFLLHMFNQARNGKWASFLFDHNGLVGLLLYWSLLGLALGFLTGSTPLPAPLLTALAVIGALGVALGEVFKHLMIGHRPLIEGGVGTYAVQAFFELFETVISFLSNSLSYVRVGAFAVAHGGLSTVFFILAEMFSPGHGVGYWIVAIAGNLFIIGFEGLVVGIQTMRLEYYEFFSKFFAAGGSKYEPLVLRPNAEN